MRRALVALMSFALVSCASTRLPPVAVVVVAFDADGMIASIESDDLGASDPLLTQCAVMVGQIRAQIRGPSAGEGTVRFGCPVQNLAHHR